MVGEYECPVPATAYVLVGDGGRTARITRILYSTQIDPKLPTKRDRVGEITLDGARFTLDSHSCCGVF